MKLKLFILLIYVSCIYQVNATVHIITAEGTTIPTDIFIPSVTNALVGDTIQWIWLSGIHTTESISLPGGAASWTSDLNSTTTTFSYVVTVAGSYVYDCHASTPHGMDGSLEVSTPVAIAITYNTVKSDCGMSNGSATLAVTGGVPPYTYQWDTNAGSQTNATATGLSVGSYSVTVSDVNMNEVLTISVGNLGAPLYFGMGFNVLCFGGNNGTLYSTPTGGTPPYTYLWSTGSTNDTVTDLIAGTYDLTLTDNAGCIVYTSMPITEPDLLVVSTSYLMVSTPTACDGSATANVTGGATPYTYLWDDGLAQQTQTANSLCLGTYNVTVIDAKNCTTLQSIYVDSIVMGIGAESYIPPMSVYPNPFTDKITVEFLSAEKIVIYNMMGQQIISIAVKNGQTKVEIDMKGLTKGIYFYAIIVDGKIGGTRKIVKN